MITVVQPNLDDLKEFDPAQYLKTPEDYRLYMAQAMDTGDAGFIAESLGVIARAKGMAELASDTGLSRGTLYRTLSSSGNPNLKTLLSILDALGLKVEFSERKKAAAV